MDSLEDAYEHQRTVHQYVDGGATFPGWRYASLRTGYKLREVPNHGIGVYVVAPDGEVCDCKMEWDADGEVLLCVKCYLDGT